MSGRDERDKGRWVEGEEELKVRDCGREVMVNRRVWRKIGVRW